MNRHSIFFKLNLLFIAALVATLVAGFFLWKHWQMRDRLQLRMQGHLLLKEWHRSGRVPREMLEMMGLRPVKKEQSVKLCTQLHSLRKRHFRHQSIVVLNKHSEGLICLRNAGEELLLHSEGDLWSRQWLPLGVLAGFLLILTALYLLLRRTLLPLKRVEREIREYGEGRVPQSEGTFVKRQDEVSQLARTFYDSTRKVRRLQESRQLFLRNILHELNTPVTKGRLLAEISEDPSTRKMLHSIFERLSLLLEEMAQIERITAQEEHLHLRPVRIVDLVDQARDRLWIDEEILVEGGGTMILADFSSLSIVFKNLIDNARKYGENLRIRLKGDRVEFLSEGPPMEHPLKWYTRPYSRSEPRAKGFGLGLYIVREILERHGMDLGYRREGGLNIFSIKPLCFSEEANFS